VKVEQRQVGTVTVLKPVGPLLGQEAGLFTSRLMDRLQSSNPRVVVQMNEVPYVDSTAIEILLEAADTADASAAPLTLVDVSPTCREILDLTGHATRFRYFGDVQDAVRSFL